MLRERAQSSSHMKSRSGQLNMENEAERKRIESYEAIKNTHKLQKEKEVCSIWFFLYLLLSSNIYTTSSSFFKKMFYMSPFIHICIIQKRIITRSHTHY
jgi:hypothetical protein